MGFFAPAPPPFELEEWKREPHLTRLKPLVQDWGAQRLRLALLRLPALRLQARRLRASARCFVISLTPGLGGLGNLGDWWTQPIVFEKFAVWTLLWEILGLGAGSMPLSFRFVPPIGGPLYWLRPGTVRLPPWPDRVPLTAGTRRTALDVALYAGVLAAGVYLLRRGGVDAAGAAAGRLPPAGIAVLLGFLALLGLRDKVSFLGARPEIYATMLVVGLFPVEPVDRRLAVRLRLHLVGRGVLEAQPPLPVRRLGDDQQRAAGRARRRSSASSGATTPRTCGPRGWPRASPTSAPCRSSAGRCSCSPSTTTRSARSRSSA